VHSSVAVEDLPLHVGQQYDFSENNIIIFCI